MARNPEHYAIIIGIDGYTRLPPLRAAASDATRLVEWLIKDDGGGLPPENVKLVVSPTSRPSNPFDARPVQQEIDKALVEMGILTKQRIGQRLYFYFAGHGVGLNFEDVAMLMATAGQGQFSYNIGLRAYRLFLHERKSFDEIIFIIDCCRNPLQGIKLGEPDFDPVQNQIDKKVQDVVVMAAKYGEKAFEPPDAETGERRSILTKAVLEGLQNIDSADPFGRITINSLWDYIEKRVPKLTNDPKLKQTPELDKRNLNDDIVIYTVPNTRLPRVKVHIDTTVEEVGANLELFDNNLRRIARQPTAQARNENPWEVFLVKGRWYIVTYPEIPNAPPLTIDLRDVKDEPVKFTYK